MLWVHGTPAAPSHPPEVCVQLGERVRTHQSPLHRPVLDGFLKTLRQAQRWLEPSPKQLAPGGRERAAVSRTTADTRLSPAGGPPTCHCGILGPPARAFDRCPPQELARCGCRRLDSGLRPQVTGRGSRDPPVHAAVSRPGPRAPPLGCLRA